MTATILPYKYSLMPNVPTPFDASIPGIAPQFGFSAPDCVYGGQKIALTANSSLASGKRGRVLKFAGSGTVTKSPTVPSIPALSEMSWIFAYDYSGDSGSTQDIVRCAGMIIPLQQRAGAQGILALTNSIGNSIWETPNFGCFAGGVSGATGFVGMVVTWSVTENAIRMYNNGVQLTLTFNSGTSTINVPLSVPSAQLCWGGAENDSEQSSTASLYFAVPLFRSLPANEARYYSLNPFAVFASTKRVWAINSVAAAAVKGSTLPMMGVG